MRHTAVGCGHDKGRISKEADADLVLLKEYYNVTWTMIGGMVYSPTKTHTLYNPYTCIMTK
ncbi:hypothetical protein [Metabacillus niabensis]|uniref:hypothetical protein n=1 Tax=Metabacillus niabensis TaxID=324854 RepID=UPI001CFA83E2|nr:hypothetical protein [Metabacillus niabensis]